MNQDYFNKSSRWLKAVRLCVLAGLAAFFAAGCATKPVKQSHQRSDLSTGVVSTELYTLIKSVTNEASIGETVTYNYNIYAKAKLRDVTLTDRVPAGSQMISSTPGASAQGDMLVWNLGVMEPGETQNVQLNVKATESGTLASCAFLTAIPIACTQTEIGQAKIAITKSGPSTAKVGQNVTFDVVVSNPGNQTARDVVMTDTIPAGLTGPEGKSVMTYTIGELPAGESRSFTVPTTANKRGTHVNVAEVTTSNAGNAKDDATVVILQPGLSIAKSGPAEEFIGKNATYSMTVKNEGDTSLKNVVVTDTVPSPLRLISASGAQVNGNVATWSVGSLGKGESKSFSLLATSPVAGSYTNSVTVTESEDGLSDSASATTLWKGYPALLIELVDTIDPLLIGDNTQYIITVTNQGSASDQNVALRVMFPEQIKPLSVSGATSGKIDGQIVTFAPVANLGAKQVVKYTIDAKSASTGDGRTKVEMTSNLLKNPVTVEESTQVY